MSSSENKYIRKQFEFRAGFFLALSFAAFVLFGFLMLRKGEYWGPLILPFGLALAGVIKSKTLIQRVIGIILFLLIGSVLVIDLISFIFD